MFRKKMFKNVIEATRNTDKPLKDFSFKNASPRDVVLSESKVGEYLDNFKWVTTTDEVSNLLNLLKEASRVIDEAPSNRKNVVENNIVSKVRNHILEKTYITSWNLLNNSEVDFDINPKLEEFVSEMASIEGAVFGYKVANEQFDFKNKMVSAEFTLEGVSSLISVFDDISANCGDKSNTNSYLHSFFEALEIDAHIPKSKMDKLKKVANDYSYFLNYPIKSEVLDKTNSTINLVTKEKGYTILPVNDTTVKIAALLCDHKDCDKDKVVDAISMAATMIKKGKDLKLDESTVYTVLENVYLKADKVTDRIDESVATLIENTLTNDKPVKVDNYREAQIINFVKSYKDKVIPVHMFDRIFGDLSIEHKFIFRDIIANYGVRDIDEVTFKFMRSITKNGTFLKKDLAENLYTLITIKILLNFNPELTGKISDKSKNEVFFNMIDLANIVSELSETKIPSYLKKVYYAGINSTSEYSTPVLRTNDLLITLPNENSIRNIHFMTMINRVSDYRSLDALIHLMEIDSKRFVIDLINSCDDMELIKKVCNFIIEKIKKLPEDKIDNCLAYNDSSFRFIYYLTKVNGEIKDILKELNAVCIKKFNISRCVEKDTALDYIAHDVNNPKRIVNNKDLCIYLKNLYPNLDIEDALEFINLVCIKDNIATDSVAGDLLEKLANSLEGDLEPVILMVANQLHSGLQKETRVNIELAKTLYELLSLKGNMPTVTRTLIEGLKSSFNNENRNEFNYELMIKSILMEAVESNEDNDKEELDKITGKNDKDSKDDGEEDIDIEDEDEEEDDIDDEDWDTYNEDPDKATESYELDSKTIKHIDEASEYIKLMEGLVYSIENGLIDYDNMDSLKKLKYGINAPSYDATEPHNEKIKLEALLKECNYYQSSGYVRSIINEESKLKSVASNIKDDATKTAKALKNAAGATSDAFDAFVTDMSILSRKMKSGLSNLSAKEKQMSNNLDNMFDRTMKKMKEADNKKSREAIIKGNVLPTFSTMVKTLCLGGGMIALGVPILGFITIIGKLGLSVKNNLKARDEILDELEIQHKVINRRLNALEGSNSDEDHKTYATLLKAKSRINKEYNNIVYKTKAARAVMRLDNNKDDK